MRASNWGTFGGVNRRPHATIAFALATIGVLCVLWLRQPTLVQAQPVASTEPWTVLGGQPVRVDAKHLQVDLKKATAVLEGDVHVAGAGLELWCERMEAAYESVPSDPSVPSVPLIRWAKATGPVRAKMGAWEAKAGEARLDWSEGRLRLLRGVDVRHGGAWIKAAEARIDLRDKHVTLQQVSGMIPLPAASGLHRTGAPGGFGASVASGQGPADGAVDSTVDSAAGGSTARPVDRARPPALAPSGQRMQP